MNLCVRIEHRDRHLSRRVRDIAQEAASLVARRVGALPRTELILTNGRDLGKLATDAERAVAGGGSAGRRPDESVFGRTVLSPGGVLVLVNADRHTGRGRDEVDTTLVHELVHAAQFHRPGARAELLAGLRHNYGIEPISDSRARAMNRRIDRDEREATRLERLARHLS
ncbi:hypothetical protein [Streptomyces iconiensis]|uniref:DUF4157 domain-containing protein n=1 Tax=Streptomyces iconiensis TaxID=1384038 RepID=A0ABT7AB21_9ACTN|nr:hypothetical protein [Streptomyces iconiensis]MDJ1138543.1 hypothetical protein [Streptomyces iconiensis]